MCLTANRFSPASNQLTATVEANSFCGHYYTKCELAGRRFFKEIHHLLLVPLSIWLLISGHATATLQMTCQSCNVVGVDLNVGLEFWTFFSVSRSGSRLICGSPFKREYVVTVRIFWSLVVNDRGCVQT